MLLADFYVSGVGVQQLQHKWVIAPAAVLLVAICMLPIRQWLWVRVSYPFLIAFFYYLILQNPVLKKVFSYKFIPVIGGMCYSIYLLHTTIITVFGRLTLKLSITSHYLPNLLLQLGLLSTIILLVSATFYLFLERPFMRHKWMKKKRH